jgi:hypothetical protein
MLSTGGNLYSVPSSCQDTLLEKRKQMNVRSLARARVEKKRWELTLDQLVA